MSKIVTFVFFDIETTGLPHMERNRTKITELCFVAAIREDILRAELGKPPLASKLCFIVNPQKQVSKGSEILTGLSNQLLDHSPTFKQKIGSITAFLEGLPKPVCLVAHNGNAFDYKILLAEFVSANASLPEDLLCIDSLVGFRKILKDTDLKYSDLIKTAKTEVSELDDNLLTDDEDDFPDLNITSEEWDEIDDLCSSLSDISCDGDILKIEEKKVNKTEAIKKVFDKKPNKNVKKSVQESNTYKLTDLYKRLLSKDGTNAHRAEADCLMLAECVVAVRKDFLSWADDSCKKLSMIKPLVPYS